MYQYLTLFLVGQKTAFDWEFHNMRAPRPLRSERKSGYICPHNPTQPHLCCSDIPGMTKM